MLREARDKVSIDSELETTDFCYDWLAKEYKHSQGREAKEWGGGGDWGKSGVCGWNEEAEQDKSGKETIVYWKQM